MFTGSAFRYPKCRKAVNKITCSHAALSRSDRSWLSETNLPLELRGCIQTAVLC